MLIRKIEIVLLLGFAVTYRPALAEAANILDVALGKGGTFQGRLLDSDGQPVANRVVSVEQGKRAIKSVTNKNGVFSVSGLRGGGYQFTGTDGSRQSYRLWAHGTQPPSAQSGSLLLYAEAEEKGGQGNGKGKGKGKGEGKPDKPPKECRLSPSHPRYNPDTECPPASP